MSKHREHNSKKHQLFFVLSASALIVSGCGQKTDEQTGANQTAAQTESAPTSEIHSETAETNAAAPDERADDKLFFSMDAEGNLRRPVDYREWVYVGTPLTPNELNPPEASFPEFHNVYIDPVSWNLFKETGEFRDGTILIKELATVGSKMAVSGNGYFMGDFIGLEATIKSAEYFPDEPGNWAYFSFGHSYPLAETAEAFPAQVCNACHLASAATDFVFTQYYPVLRARSASVIEQGPETMESGARTALTSVMTTATAAIEAPRAETGTSPGPVPTDLDALFAYLTNKEYESFATRESGTHPSRGPHTNFGSPVRVFYSDELAASFAAGNDVHPAGSSVVKEMYEDDGVSLKGWAVSVKTQDDSDGGNGWFWYEVVSTTDSAAIAGEAGNGIPLCTSCHTGGEDFVLTGYPL